MWCPSSLAKLVYKYYFTRVYGGYIYSIHGIINQLITGGAQPCNCTIQSQIETGSPIAPTPPASSHDPSPSARAHDSADSAVSVAFRSAASSIVSAGGKHRQGESHGHIGKNGAFTMKKNMKKKLVGGPGPPLWKIWTSIGMMTFPILMGTCKKWQPFTTNQKGKMVVQTSNRKGGAFTSCLRL